MVFGQKKMLVIANQHLNLAADPVQKMFPREFSVGVPAFVAEFETSLHGLAIDGRGERPLGQLVFDQIGGHVGADLGQAVALAIDFDYGYVIFLNSPGEQGNGMLSYSYYNL